MRNLKKKEKSGDERGDSTGRRKRRGGF